MQYWDERYRLGGNSGGGSRGRLREWKWSVIENYAERVDDVVDIGCGDLSFWIGRTCEKYVGIDISSFVIQRNRELRPTWTFLTQPAEKELELSGNLVICMDLLFHILDEEKYLAILSNLARYSNEWIFVYTWHENPLNSTIYKMSQAKNQVKQRKIRAALSGMLSRQVSDGVYERFRNFERYVPFFNTRGFLLLAAERNKSVDKFGSMYVFRKDAKSEAVDHRD